MIQFYHQIIHYDLEITYYKMSISEKFKAINNKNEQNKVQYNLNIQNNNICTLLSGNVNNKNF